MDAPVIEIRFLFSEIRLLLAEIRFLRTDIMIGWFLLENSQFNITKQFAVFVFQEHAFESSQKYKEGKYIIEVAHMIKDNRWN